MILKYFFILFTTFNHWNWFYNDQNTLLNEVYSSVDTRNTSVSIINLEKAPRLDSAYLRKELLNFDNRKLSKSTVSVNKIENVKPYLNFDKYDDYDQLTKQINWSQIDDVNITNLFILPLEYDKISKKSILKILDQLSEKSLRSVSKYYTATKSDLLAKDDDIFNKILELSSELPNPENHYIKFYQRPLDSKPEIIEMINNIIFYRIKNHRLPHFLSVIASMGDDELTLEMVEKALEITDYKQNVALYKYESIFRILLESNKEIVRSKIRALIFRYLKNSTTNDAQFFQYFLASENQKSVAELINKKIEDLNNYTYDEKYDEELAGFYRSYIVPYARINASNYIPFIDKAPVTNKNKTESNIRTIKYEELNALEKILLEGRYSQKQKNKIANYIDDYLQDVSSYKHKDVKIPNLILVKLFPNRTYQDFAPYYKRIKDIGKSYKYLFSTDNLEEYLNYFDSIGIQRIPLTKEIRNKYMYHYYSLNDNILILGALLLTGNSIYYTESTNKRPELYDIIIDRHIEYSEDLKDFYTIMRYKLLEDDLIEYTLLLTDGKVGYETKFKYGPSSYEPEIFNGKPIQKLLNFSLQDLGSKKRFVRLNDLNYNQFYYYEEPGRIKKIVEKFDLRYGDRF